MVSKRLVGFYPTEVRETDVTVEYNWMQAVIDIAGNLLSNVNKAFIVMKLWVNSWLKNRHG